MPDISVAIALLKKPIDAVLSVATGKAKDTLAFVKAEGRIKTIYQKLNSTQKVKTIWDVDRARSLSSFYYPAKIRTEGGSQQLASIDELPGNAIVLSGTVGQGKSILLRHLLGREIRSGSRIPVFIELRKVPDTGIEAYLRDTFNDLIEISGHPEIFELFAKAGKVSLLLDGFDEIEPSKTQEVMVSIERLVSRFPEARVIVTSRPKAGIETSPLFDVVHIAPLSDGDFSGFFRRILPKDRALADMITNAVLNSKSVKMVASTPLLATLLTIVYRSTQRIPASFAEFYDELFQILLVRHDRSKALSRRRKTTLGDREIQKVFEAFCFKSHAEGRSVIVRDRALEISRLSILAQDLQCREDDFLTDIVRVTCLLQEDGNQIEFVHESVREFFAAKYIGSRPDDIVQKFYEKLPRQGTWRKWEQVIKFLSQLDKYRASLLYLIPVAHDFLKAVHSDSSPAAAPRLRMAISDLAGVKRVENWKPGDKRPEFSGYLKYPNNNPYWDIVNVKIFSAFFGPSGFALSSWHSAFTDKSVQSMTFTELATHCGKTLELDTFLGGLVSEIRAEVSALESSVQVVDSSADFMGL